MSAKRNLQAVNAVTETAIETATETAPTLRTVAELSAHVIEARRIGVELQRLALQLSELGRKESQIVLRAAFALSRAK